MYLYFVLNTLTFLLPTKCFYAKQNSRDNPIHIINVSLKNAETEDDDALVKDFADFTQSKVNHLLH